MTESELINICGIDFKKITKFNDLAYKYYNDNDIKNALEAWNYIIKKLKPLIIKNSNLEIFKNSYTIQILGETLCNIEIIFKIIDKDKISKYPEGIYLIKLMKFKKYFDKNYYTYCYNSNSNFLYEDLSLDFDI